MLVKVQTRQAWMTRFFKGEISRLRAQLAAQVKAAGGKSAVLTAFNYSVGASNGSFYAIVNATPDATNP